MVHEARCRNTAPLPGIFKPTLSRELTVPRLPVACLLFGLVACSDSSVAVEGPELPLLDPAADWVGTYQGSGVGIVDGRPVVIENAVIAVSFDAADIQLVGCTNCVTVTLDDIFFLANVRIDNLTAVDLAYVEGPVRYTLVLRRFTLGIDHPNVLRARATYGNVGVSVPIFDVEYTLER